MVHRNQKELSIKLQFVSFVKNVRGKSCKEEDTSKFRRCYIEQWVWMKKILHMYAHIFVCVT